jgi:hypothetical protein
LTALHRFSGAIRLDPALYSEQDRVWVAANSQPILRRGVPLYYQLGMVGLFWTVSNVSGGTPVDAQWLWLFMPLMIIGLCVVFQTPKRDFHLAGGPYARTTQGHPVIGTIHLKV